MNKHDFYIGKTFDAYKYFGAHMEEDGIIFRVYAPNAKKVSLIGEWNQWTPEDMIREGTSGIYTFRSKNAKKGMLYKYKIHGQDDSIIDHCDPYGFEMELRPNSASVIADIFTYEFKDKKWMKKRDKNYNKPLNIYELHAGSWRQADGEWYTYDELAEILIPYIKENGYTHIEFLPLSEHPADCSWGYQNTGFFSPTKRFGTGKQLMRLIDKCHQEGIGVILDFVPIHFALDNYGLAKFDGSYLYEYPSDDVGVSEWGTHNFNLARGEVRSLLQSAANYWLTEYHFDGLRMDAISRAIYWMGDSSRGVNECSVEFIKNMNDGLHRLHPTAMLMAEDSTDFLKVTAPVEYDGLGFDYKWDMGWMNDTLNYFKTPPEERPSHYHKLTFSMHYFYNELFMLPLSHDEVVHGKATIIQKMWGDYEDKFKQCRAFYMYMYTHPGKKLNFMGNEIAQFREWDEKREQDWDILTYPIHDAFCRYINKLNHIYIKYPALYEMEYNRAYFKWLISDKEEDSIYAYQRGDKMQTVIMIFNFSDEIKIAELPWTKNKKLKELLNSDWQTYGGETKEPRKKVTTTKEIKMNPFSGRMFLLE